MVRPLAAKGRPYGDSGPLLSVGADVPIGPNRRRVREAAPRQKVSYKNFSSVIKWNEISP